MTTSVYLSRRALGALIRLGNLLCPGTPCLPRFEASGCIAQVDELLHTSPHQDRADLQRLLWWLSWLPEFLLRGLLGLVGRWTQFPELLQTPLRMIDLGLRGVVFSLYYSGLGAAGQLSGVHEGMEYSLHCEPDVFIDHSPTQQGVKPKRSST